MSKKNGKIGRCYLCLRANIGINSVDPKSGENICRACFRAATGRRPVYKRKNPRSNCSLCGKKMNRMSPYFHPDTKERIHRKCFVLITRKFICKKGKCATCGKGPRDIPYIDPETKLHICRYCYRTITGKNKLIVGICASCKKGPKPTPYLDPFNNRLHICQNCWQKKH